MKKFIIVLIILLGVNFYLENLFYDLHTPHPLNWQKKYNNVYANKTDKKLGMEIQDIITKISQDTPVKYNSKIKFNDIRKIIITGSKYSHLPEKSLEKIDIYNYSKTRLITKRWLNLRSTAACIIMLIKEDNTVFPIFIDGYKFSINTDKVQCNNEICTTTNKQTTITLNNYNDTAILTIE